MALDKGNINYFKFFDLSHNLLCILNDQFQVVECNDSTIPVVNFTKNEVLGKNFLSCMHQVDLGFCKSKLEYLVKSGGEHKEEFYALMFNELGSYTYLKWSFTYDPDQKLLYGVGRDYSTEIKNERKLQGYKDRIKELQSIAKLGTWEMDVKTKNIIWSETMFQLFDRTQKEGAPSFTEFLNTVVEEDRMKLIVAIDQSINENKGYEVKVRHEIKEGEIIHVIARGLPMVVDGYVKKLYGTVLDISKQKIAEQELLLSKLEAEKLARIKQQFLANMSHEIRTPLNAIIGFTEMMKENSTFSASDRSNIDAIFQAGNHLLGVVNDILDFTKIEEGGICLELSSMAFKDHLKSIYGQYKILADKKNLNFSLEIDGGVPDYVLGDSLRLQQILNNLISNALKFTSKGTVEVKVKKEREEGKKVMLKILVKDTGLGISANRIDSIFESFTQVSVDTARKFGGTGLGLTIVKHLVDLHGGQIEVRSKIRKGTSFVISLPYEVSEANEEENTIIIDEADIDISGLKVLLVEDNKMNQILAKKVITRWGVDLDIADDGLAGLANVKEGNYDAILMDLAMPKMDGYTCISCIRELEGDKANVPIMAMTAHAFESEIQKCKDLGFNDYISKPFRKSDLKKKIYNLARFGGSFNAVKEKTKEEIEINSYISQLTIDQIDSIAPFIGNLTLVSRKLYDNILYDQKSELRKNAHDLKDDIDLKLHFLKPLIDLLDFVTLYGENVDRINEVKMAVDKLLLYFDELKKITQD